MKNKKKSIFKRLRTDEELNSGIGYSLHVIYKYTRHFYFVSRQIYVENGKKANIFAKVACVLSKRAKNKHFMKICP